MTLPYITEHINQPIELNKVNPEITAKTIYEHTVIDEVHDKETKPESNDELITPLVTEPEIKPEQDSQKPKTNNWIYVICFIGFAVVIVSCFVFFYTNQIFEIFQNNEQKFKIFKKKACFNFNLKSQDYYIGYICQYLLSYYNIDTKKEERTMTIDPNKIEFQNHVIFAQNQPTEQPYYYIFFKDKEIKNIIICDRSFESYEERIKKLNPKITSPEHLERFIDHFIKDTKNKIKANELELRAITDFTAFINRGLKYFPTMDQVQEWDPNQEST